MTVIASDSFDRADSDLSGSSTDSFAGGTAKIWTTTGAWSTASNELRRTSTGVEEFATIDPGAVNVIAETVLATLPLGTTGIGVIARVADASNLYLGQYAPDLGFQLYKKVAGSYTVLGSASSPSGGDTIGLSCLGSTIELLHNGSAVVTVTDSSLSSGTQVGYRVGNTDNTWRLDDFVVQSPGVVVDPDHLTEHDVASFIVPYAAVDHLVIHDVPASPASANFDSWVTTVTGFYNVALRLRPAGGYGSGPGGQHPTAGHTESPSRVDPFDPGPEPLPPDPSDIEVPLPQWVPDAGPWRRN